MFEALQQNAGALDRSQGRMKRGITVLIEHFVNWLPLAESRGRAGAGAAREADAREHTGKRNGEIDLGWIEQQRIFNPFEAMLFSLREGEIGPVFFYEQALHLVKAVEIRPSVVQAFDEIAESIREEVEHARRLQMLKELAGKLRETAVIERE